MKPHYDNGRVTLWHGDCLNVLAELADNSVDSIVTDPPYGLSNTTPAQVADTIIRWVGGERDYLPKSRGFMGASWDGFVPPVAVWDECIRVLKPGGHMAVFAGSRTQDLMGLSVRLAGFDLRDSVAWLYGSGFPKSLDVSKAIDKAAGADREVVGQGAAFGRGSLRNRSRVEQGYRPTELNPDGGSADITAPATPEAERWQGWGTALKPGHEPIILARKPFPGTVAANVQEWGTGALNIDATRIGSEQRTTRGMSSLGVMHDDDWKPRDVTTTVSGRWPANVALDADQAAALDEQAGDLSYNPPAKWVGGTSGGMWNDIGKAMPGETRTGFGDRGGASRFFYTAKAGSAERPRMPRKVLRLRDDLTPEQVDYVRARLVEAGVEVG